MDFTKEFFNLILDFGDEWVITGIDADHKKLGSTTILVGKGLSHHEKRGWHF